MSNAVAIQASIPALAMNEEELCAVLQSSLYPGATLPSIKLVVGYCRAAGLDPMQKPVHIVPMRVKKPGTTDQYEWRDVVMPGIGLYRVQAARSGQYAGVSEPEFGPMVTLRFDQFEIQVPEWCRITVRRFNEATGTIFDFAALEYWVENYATKGRDSKVPNDMWQRRPRGQLAKCAEAQALRKAFPEIGAAPTADEMEGREFEVVDVTPTTTRQAPRSKAAKAKAQAEDAVVVDGKAAPADTAAGSGQATAAPPPPAADAANDPLVGEGELAFLRNKAKAASKGLDALAAASSIDLTKLTKSGFATLKAALAS